MEELRELGEVEVTENVAVVTVVGRRIREKLPDLGKSMENFAQVLCGREGMCGMGGGKGG